jgi:hypothetical protein
VLTDTKDKIISLAVLLKAGFKVEFAAGTSDDPNFGGYLITPTGSRVALVFENNLWRVPLWSPPMHAPARYAMPAKVLISLALQTFYPLRDLLKISKLYQLLSTLLQPYNMMAFYIP